jgi:flavodoxin
MTTGRPNSIYIPDVDISGMKALVVYFSITGRTKRVAETIAAQLSRYMVDIEGITFTGTRRDLVNGVADSIAAGNWKNLSAKNIIFDVSPYDLVCIGMPVHGGAPAVVFNAYIKNCKGISGKKVCTFVTCRFTPWKSLAVMGERLRGAGAVALGQAVFKGFFRIGKERPIIFGKTMNAGE